MSGVLGGLLGSYSVAPVVAFELIETIEISSSVFSLNITGLGTHASKYRHLQIRYACRTGASGTSPVNFMRLNGSSSSYSRHRLTGDGASVSSNTDGTNQSQMTFGHVSGAATSSLYGVGVIDILDAYSTVKRKVVRTFSSVGVSTNGSIGYHTGMWEGGYSALSSIEILPPTPGEFALITGSRISIYGLRG
jgi:hypothetical protein